MNVYVLVVGNVLGVAAFILSCYNTWRSVRSDRHTRTMEFIKKQQEAATLLTRERAAYMDQATAARRIRNEAVAVSADKVSDLAQEHLDFFYECLERLKNTQNRIHAIDSTRASTDDTKRLAGLIVSMQRDGGVEYIDAAHRHFVDVSKRIIEEFADLQAKIMKLEDQRNDGEIAGSTAAVAALPPIIEKT